MKLKPIMHALIQDKIHRKMSEVKKIPNSDRNDVSAFIFCKRLIRQSPKENTNFCKAVFYMPNSLYVLDREPVNLAWASGFHCLVGRQKFRFSAIVSIVILKSFYGSRLLKTYD